MKRDRHARQIGLTSAKKVKKVGDKRYRGGTDSSKGKKKKTWLEVICSACSKVYKVTEGKRFKCKCRRQDNDNRRTT